MNLIPVIPNEKNYWLFRTNGGRYYNEFRRTGCIAINWDTITIEDINTLSQRDLILKIKRDYPDSQKPGRAANQLRIFVDQIKEGDTVLITGYGSNRVSIGVVENTTPFVTQPTVDENGDTVGCPYVKRKHVRWIREIEKLDLHKKLIRFIQRPQHTITVADEYADEIEGTIHDFFIRGDRAQLILQVRKETAIPAASFFALGSEIIQLAREFNEFAPDYKIDIDDLETQININSKGKMLLAGAAVSIMVIGILFLGVAGGNYTIKFPLVGGSLHVETPGLIDKLNEFYEKREESKMRNELMKHYIEQLDVKGPDELMKLREAMTQIESVMVEVKEPEVKEIAPEVSNEGEASEDK